MATSALDWPTIHQIGSAFRLAMPRTPIRGRLGERLGAGTGSSLEFQDYRQYAPGDDIRHVDWAAYARSEILAVRLYREEVAPRIDLVLDVSRSIALTEEKLRTYGEICGVLAIASATTEAETRIFTTFATEPRLLERPEAIEAVLDCKAPQSVLEETPLHLRRQSMRIVVSDFLFPHDADHLLGALARDAASLALIQLNLAEEVTPRIEGGRRLVDVEGRGQLDLLMDDRAVREYCERFNRLRSALSRSSRRVGARFVHITAGTPLRDIARALALAGILEPA